MITPEQIKNALASNEPAQLKSVIGALGRCGNDLLDAMDMRVIGEALSINELLEASDEIYLLADEIFTVVTSSVPTLFIARGNTDE